MKKRDFFAILAAGAAIAVAVQALGRWLSGESEYDECDEDYNCDCADCREEQEDSEGDAMNELLNYAYDEGFADGINCDYQGCNPAAQVLQAELNELLDECAVCQCEIGDRLENETDKPEDGDNSKEQQTE